MNKDKLPEFKALFDEYKSSDEYKLRNIQTAFTLVAKNIIAETLKNKPFIKEYLTGFIQMFKWGTQEKTFEKYLAINIKDKNIFNDLKKQYQESRESGYTGAGKNAIITLKPEQLEIIKQFLLNAFKIETTDEAKKLTDQFEKQNIPEVKEGIYSPWLHYINSEIFPVTNNSHNLFLKWMGIRKKYSDLIEDFELLKETTHELHLGMIDSFTHTFNSESAALQNNLIEINNTTMNVLSKNIILFGPPGTGKTYNSIDKAVEIITTKKDSHEQNKKVFDELRKEGQIEFVTFHQNYSYEDFMVGLKPDAEFEQLRFRPFKGIFYEIARRARENYKAYKESRSKEKTFDEVFNEITQPLTEGDEVEVKMKSGISYWIYDVNSSSVLFRKQNGSTAHSLSIDTLRGIVDDMKPAPPGLESYYTPLISLLTKRKKQSQEVPIEKLKNFVLIIDEINRANISRVFGELITLLEDDKRLGEPNELKITLPNGEKEFGVPPNLYLIGTMNTADKSIALVDIALRRRFEFVGYYPDYELKELETSKVELLKQINSNIYSKKKSADYLIGHAYFLNNSSIESILRNKVVPLLMEYFAGKTEIVSEIFAGSKWAVSYNTERYDWDIQKAKSN